MRPGQLYIKILLSFLAVLFITFLVIFAVFHTLPGKHFRTRLEDFAKTKALVIKETVEEKIRSTPTTALSDNESLKKLIFDFGRILGAKVWLQDSGNAIPIQSFPDEIPEIIFRLKKNRARTYDNMTFYHGRGFDFYTVIPIALPRGERGTFHVLFESQEKPFRPDHPEGIFALGLFLIGLLAALLFIPISRIITKRLDKLRQSALIISEGNLSHRASIKGKDEISELAQSFNRMAEKLESMIVNARELTANVSHELRTPLTRIRISEEMLREKLIKSNGVDYERYLDEIVEDIQELDHLIGRILELSKMDIQGSPLTFAPFDPAELIRGLLSRFQPMIRQKDLEAVLDLSLIHPFEGDKEALATALLNLLDNAVKFTPEKGRINIHMHSESDLLMIHITNTSEILPESELFKIFDPFHRGKQSRTAGSGLGLAITKKIIERHGGKIGAYNAEMGLEIRISLPNHQEPV
jgi:signal transduction histidine kinase